MQLSIRSKLYGLGVLGLASAVLVGGAGLRGILLVARGIQDVTATSSAIRSHMEASMFLDLTRSDVSKMLTSTSDQQDTAILPIGRSRKAAERTVGGGRVVHQARRRPQRPGR